MAGEINDEDFKRIAPNLHNEVKRQFEESTVTNDHGVKLYFNGPEDLYWLWTDKPYVFKKINRGDLQAICNRNPRFWMDLDLEQLRLLIAFDIREARLAPEIIQAYHVAKLLNRRPQIDDVFALGLN